jgi:predicted nucleotidyltransferase component of viral defense system
MLTEGGVPSRAVLDEVALLMGINEAFVEKDWFVTKVINVLVQHPQAGLGLVFTGGTALSKAHKLIERFSEDVDFRVVGPALAGRSMSAVRKTLSGFREHLVAVLTGAGVFSVLSVDSRDGNRYLKIDLAYPTAVDTSALLRPHIKLEFTVAELMLPGLLLPVSSFVNETARKPPEVAQIACIDPVENAADKLSAITWRVPARIRGLHDRQPDLVRHLHDLAKLSGRALSSPDFVRVASLTIERDASRETVQPGLTTAERLNRLLTILETDSIYPTEYDTFIHGMSYAQDALVPTYTEALRAIRLLTKQLSP